MEECVHIVLTKYNVRMPMQWCQRGLEPDWLAGRWQLFQKYCLRSMKTQTTGEFHWLLFCDRQTPSPYREQLAGLQSPGTHVYFCEELTRAVLLSAVRDHVHHDTRAIVTTRLDNDDALCPSYLEDVRNAVQGSHRHWINWDTGIVMCGRRAYRRVDRANAFISFVEPNGNDIQTTWSCPHPEAGKWAPVHHIGSAPGWVQLVHGDNVSNRKRGRLVNPSIVSNRFPNLGSISLEEPGIGTYIFDRGLAGPVRLLRDTIRVAGRTVKCSMRRRDQC